MGEAGKSVAPNRYAKHVPNAVRRCKLLVISWLQINETT
jgi:hypothetical protein